MGFYVEYIIKIWMLFTKHPITFGHNDDLQTMKHLVDSTICLLIISANRMSCTVFATSRANCGQRCSVKFLQFRLLIEKSVVLAYSTLVMIEMG